MTHATGGVTFEQHYEQGTFDLPGFEIPMRADTNLARATMDEETTLALTRMVKAPIYILMTVRQMLPTFEIKDAKNAQVTSGRARVMPYARGDKVFIDLMLAQEAHRTIKSLVGAAQLIFKIRHPEAEIDAENVPRHINFTTQLGMWNLKY